jgi:hypothetical protein
MVDISMLAGARATSFLCLWSGKEEKRELLGLAWGWCVWGMAARAEEWRKEGRLLGALAHFLFADARFCLLGICSGFGRKGPFVAALLYWPCVLLYAPRLVYV